MNQVANLPPDSFGDPQQDIQDPFVLNPFVLNPFVLNYTEENPFVLNTSQTNFSASNPFVLNPFVLNTALYDGDGTPKYPIYDVVDTSWTVQTDNPTNLALTTNTASTYIPLINIDNASAYRNNYAFQLIVYKTSYSAGYRQARDENDDPIFDELGDPVCEAYSIPHDQISPTCSGTGGRPTRSCSTRSSSIHSSSRTAPRTRSCSICLYSTRSYMNSAFTWHRRKGLRR